MLQKVSQHGCVKVGSHATDCTKVPIVVGGGGSESQLL